MIGANVYTIPQALAAAILELECACAPYAQSLTAEDLEAIDVAREDLHREIRRAMRAAVDAEMRLDDCAEPAPAVTQ